MPLDQDAIDALKSELNVARKRDLNFAICLGKKPEATVLKTHKVKGPEILQRQAKKEGETTKVFSGLMKIKSKDMLLTCEDPPPGGSAKKVKVFLKSIGLSMKVKLLSADGELLEDDGQDEDSEDIATASVEESDPNQARWEAASKKLTPEILAALRDGHNDASKLRAMWGYAQETAGDGDYVGALKVLARIAPMLKDTGEAPAPDEVNPNRARWLEAVGKLEPVYNAAMAAGVPEADKLRAAWALAQKTADAGKHADALKILTKIAPSLKGAGAQATQDQAAEKDVTSNTTDNPDPLLAKWQTIERATADLLQQALGNNPPNRSKIEAAWAMAVEAAGAGDPAKAIKIVEQLVPVLKNAANAQPDTSAIPEGIVKKRRFMITRWQKIPGEIKTSIDRLRNAMIAEVPEEDPKALADQMQANLDSFVAAIQDKMDDAINTGDPTYKSTIKLIDDAVKGVSSYDLIQHIKNNPFDSSADVETVLLDALKEIRTELAS
ncbi:MAG: hypothetical protein AAF557_13590 [Pseudomonadota bacterium]